MDPRIQIRIRIHPKMSWIRNTGFYYRVPLLCCNLLRAVFSQLLQLLSFQLPVSHLPNKQLFLAAVLQLLDVESGEPPVHIRPFSPVEELTALAQKGIWFRHWLKRVHRNLSLRVCLWCLVVSGGGAGVHNCSGNVRLLNKDDANAVSGIRDILVRRFLSSFNDFKDAKKIIFPIFLSNNLPAVLTIYFLLNFMLNFILQALFQSDQHIYEKRAGSGSVPLTNGSGSGRPKNLRIQIGIPNTVLKNSFFSLWQI